MGSSRHQQPATVGDADVRRVVERDFQETDLDRVLSDLASYGAESWHREPARVRLAILKLAGGEIEKLEGLLALARSDYRDVLAMAEYPAYLTLEIQPEERAEEEAIESDREQYERWLKKG